MSAAADSPISHELLTRSHPLASSSKPALLRPAGRQRSILDDQQRLVVIVAGVFLADSWW